MRILFCNYEYPPLGGGGGVMNAMLAQEMSKRHDITVLTSQGLGLPKESVEGNVRVIRVPVLFREQEAVANLNSMFAYILAGTQIGKKLIKAEPFDVINTHFVLPTGPVGDALARSARVPNVLSLHGGDLYDPSKFLSPHRHLMLRVWIKRLLKRADLIVGQSRDTLANMRRFYLSEMGGVRIPLAIERPPVETGSRAEYGFDQDDVLLVTVGRLVTRKGLPQLIEMMEHFKGEKVHLLVMGSGPEEEALKADVAQRQLTSQIHFQGFVEESEKFRLLRMSDLYVSTSQHEGFGLVFLEAMACGLPVICYDYGGQTDFLRDHKTGYLIPLNDLDTFYDKCRTLINNSELRRTMGDHNHIYAEEFFIETCAANYEQVFLKAIEMKSGHRATHMIAAKAQKNTA